MPVPAGAGAATDRAAVLLERADEDPRVAVATFPRGHRATGRGGQVAARAFPVPPWLTRTAARSRASVRADEAWAHSLGGVPQSNLVRGRTHSVDLDCARELGALHAVVDARQGFTSSVPPVWETTHPKLARVRLYGRNAGRWNSTTSSASSDRFNYIFLDAEQQNLVQPIRGLSKSVLETHVVFNNNIEDRGQGNAVESICDGAPKPHNVDLGAMPSARPLEGMARRRRHMTAGATQVHRAD